MIHRELCRVWSIPSVAHSKACGSQSLAKLCEFLLICTADRRIRLEILLQCVHLHCKFLRGVVRRKARRTDDEKGDIVYTEGRLKPPADGGPSRARTCNLAVMSGGLYHWAMGPCGRLAPPQKKGRKMKRVAMCGGVDPHSLRCARFSRPAPEPSGFAHHIASKNLHKRSSMVFDLDRLADEHT